MPVAPDCGRPDGRAATPLDDDELRRLGDAAFAGLRSIVLAVSGGPDSMALMVLAERWLAARPRSPTPVHVATVDHGLREGSAEEARWVGRQARSLLLPHHGLAWTGTKPATGLQAAARTARYALLTGLAETLRLPSPVGIAVAHHADDQAETVLMRLARGSGLDGISGMPAVRRLPVAVRLEDGKLIDGPKVRIVRPFLDVPRSRLAATLKARHIAWLADPSNANPDFERVRVRKAMAGLAMLGLTTEALATSARRLARARAALEQATDDLADRAVALHEGAYASVEVAAFGASPVELRLRLMQRLVRWFGGRATPPRMTKLEALVERLTWPAPVAATLSGCEIRRTDTRLLVLREPGRQGLPVITLEPGVVATWDGRFVVGVGAGWPGTVTVKAVPKDLLTRFAADRRRLERAGGSRRDLPRPDLPQRAALTLPSFWEGDRLLAVPHPAFAGCESGTSGIDGACGGPVARFIHV